MNLKRLLSFLIVPLLLTACPSGRNRADAPDLGKLPRTILSGEQGPFHVQGIAVDLERGYIYFSFTTKLLKMDLAGNLIGRNKRHGLLRRKENLQRPVVRRQPEGNFGPLRGVPPVSG